MKRKRSGRLSVPIIPLLLASALLTIPLAAQPHTGSTFTNPLLPTGPDPWVIFDHGMYYYMNTTAINLTIWKTGDITDLIHAQNKIVWTPPVAGPYSKDIWAPELHRLNGKWYIYFAADDGINDNHRLWVLENSSPDPLTGEWQMKGMLDDGSGTFAIDPTVFETNGVAYLLWSGWESAGVRDIYIAKLKNPWTIDGPRIRLSTPQYPWEKVGDIAGTPGVPLTVPHVDVNEGPEILQHGGKTFLIYSASACWTDYYELGMLTASDTSNPLDPTSWTKSPDPVFWQSAAASAFGPGHNTFFPSPDGTEEWILFHANPEPDQGCGGHRQPRAQPIHWNSDGTPNFGRPIPLGQPIQKPSGTD